MRPVHRSSGSARAGRPRSAITLTEILIAILIMGVGLVSLATLFPLGMLRARRAFQDSRSTMLAESAISEIPARNLLSSASFALAGWYNGTFTDPSTFVDPWQFEAITGGAQKPHLNTFTNARTPEPGLVVCYDPLWWSVHHYNTSRSNPSPWLTGDTPAVPAAREAARFGIGLHHLRRDPDNNPPSAHGLQRVTNFRFRATTTDTFPFLYPTQGNPVPPTLPAPDVATSVFASPDTILFNQEGSESPGQDPRAFSPLLPDFSLSASGTEVAFDIEYSWFFTGQRANAQDDASYVGSIVVVHKRPVGIDQVNTPSGMRFLPIGERVVEAIWGYSGTNVTPSPLLPPGPTGYGNGERTVLIRWLASTPEPAVRPGGFIADVTYERSAALEQSRFRTTPGRTSGDVLSGDVNYPAQRCDWYRVAAVTPPEAARPFANDQGPYLQMVVTLETPVKAKTRLAVNNGHPVHVNAALINAYVVNVFPKTFVNRNN